MIVANMFMIYGSASNTKSHNLNWVRSYSGCGRNGSYFYLDYTCSAGIMHSKESKTIVQCWSVAKQENLSMAVRGD